MTTDYEIQIWDTLNEICNNCKGKPIKGILVKRKLIHKGGKYKWQNGQELYFSFEDILFTASRVEYYEDSNDYKQKNIIVSVIHAVYDFKNIEKPDILKFLKFKSRVVKINKFLKENN